MAIVLIFVCSVYHRQEISEIEQSKIKKKIVLIKIKNKCNNQDDACLHIIGLDALKTDSKKCVVKYLTTVLESVCLCVLKESMEQNETRFFEFFFSLFLFHFVNIHACLQIKCVCVCISFECKFCVLRANITLSGPLFAMRFDVLTNFIKNIELLLAYFYVDFFFFFLSSSLHFSLFLFFVVLIRFSLILSISN